MCSSMICDHRLNLDAAKYSNEFIEHFVPVIRAMRNPDPSWNTLRVIPSMNECLDMLHYAMKEYERKNNG